LGHEAAWDLQNIGGLDTKGFPKEKDSELLPRTDRPENLSTNSGLTSRRSIAAKNSSPSSYLPPPSMPGKSWLRIADNREP